MLRRSVVALMAAGNQAPRVLTLDRVPTHIREAQYAVRGELAIRAEKYKEQLAAGTANLPFKEIIHCNIGNPQQLNQKPITFFRQVSSLLDYPDLLQQEKREFVSKIYPQDAIERAANMQKYIGSTGAYSHSKGIPFIRKDVAKFIEERDGFPSDPENIFLTAGASDGVKAVLSVIIDKPNVGIMIPIPQYPLYSASLTLFHGRPVPYYLDEAKEWSLSPEELQRAVKEARAQGTDVRALVVINPGNPTGQCLSFENMQKIVEVCQKEHLVLLADEVYQTNTYLEKKPFHSFKKVVKSMGSAYDNFELFSFHSVSKGMIGECGRRGGYFECHNIDQEVVEQLYKLASISLCPSVQGQIMVDLMVNPPKPGEPSYKQYQQEVNDIYGSLKRRAIKLVEGFNKMEGVTCNHAEGAMYAFPQIRLPAGAVRAAKAAGQQPDAFYCLAMLDATGVCVVPGSGFGQVDGTFHFRATFLPPEDKFDAFIASLAKFHADFMNKHRN